MENVTSVTSTILALKVRIIPPSFSLASTSLSMHLPPSFSPSLPPSLSPSLPPSLPFSLPPSPFLQIPIDNKVEITFHYKQCFSLVKRIDGTLPCLCCLSPFNRITPSPFYLFPLLFFLLCPLSLSIPFLFSHTHTVQQYANSVLEEIFPCLVACKLVEDKYVF